MSFTEEKRNRIKLYILEKIEENQGNIVKKTAEVFHISLNTVYRYIRELEQENVIKKKGSVYEFKEKTAYVLLKRAKGELEEEDKIYSDYVDEYIRNLPDNVKKIWQYSFMEMMNNAIDHSQAESVYVYLFQSYMNTTIMIRDDGIGIFKKIREYYHYDSLDDAVNELFKGKLTTDSQNHSGEGIFFTSRVLDRFAAVSDGKIFTHDKFSEMLRSLEDIDEFREWNRETEWQQGTVIYMELSNFSKKTSKEIFDMFSNEEGGFTRTCILLRNMFETYPVSRSQAKRLCHRFDKFQEIELDFREIEEIGQGFAHEIFVVFQNAHKDVKLVPMNMSEEVEKMIRHVLKTVN